MDAAGFVSLLFLFSQGPAFDAAPLTPRPSEAAIAQAEKDAADLFGKDIEAARKPADKKILVAKLLATARGLAGDPAGRYVLALRARDLAVTAGDAAQGVGAAETLAGYEAGGEWQAASGKQLAELGHKLWKEADDLRGPEQLPKRLEAAEWYFRALDGLAGLDAALAEKRVRSLGWKGWPIDFRFDGRDTDGWRAENHVADLTVKDGCLAGRIVGGDPHVLRTGVDVDGSECTLVEIRMAVTGATRGQFFWTTVESPRWSDDKFLRLTVIGDGRMRLYRVNVGSHEQWKGHRITGLRLDPGEWDHRSVQDETFSIDYLRAR